MRLVIVGLAAFFLTVVVREIWPFKDLVRRNVKPWACNLCMSFWTALLMTGVVTRSGRTLEEVVGLHLAGGGICYLLLHVYEFMAPPPPPELR